MSGAERKRRYRTRREAGQFVLPVVISADDIDGLVANGHIADALEPDAISVEVAALIRKLAKR